MFAASIQSVGVTELLDRFPLDREFASAGDEEFRTIHADAMQQLALARKLLSVRKLRDEQFGCGLFSDPAWEILLTLYVSKLQQVRLKATSVIEESGVPSTTVLRWVATLCERGIVVKSSNPTDARCTLLELSDAAAANMANYLSYLRKTVVGSLT